MNDILKEARKPRYRTVEEALPEYFLLIKYYENLSDKNKGFLEKEIIKMNMEYKILEHTYREKELFNLIYKMGFKAYQVINHSFNHWKEVEGATIGDWEVERVFIEHIVKLSKHTLEIAEYYLADNEIKFYVQSTINDGTKFADTIYDAFLEYR